MLKNKSTKTIFIIWKILNDSFMYLCVHICIQDIQHIYKHIHIYAFIPSNFWGSQLIKLLWFRPISDFGVWIRNKLYSSSRYLQFFCPLKINDRDEFYYLIVIHYKLMCIKSQKLLAWLFFALKTNCNHLKIPN